MAATDDHWSPREMVDWLLHLAAKGGKGKVDSVDARALGRAGRMILRLERELKEARCATTKTLDEALNSGDGVYRP